MSFTQLEEIFKQATIDEGIPEGASYGYAMVDPSLPGATNMQVVADVMWKGKRLEVVQGENCRGRDCGQEGVVINFLGSGERVTWQEMPGIAYIGHLKDIKPSLEVLQLDEKPSVIVDYRNGGGGDELRLVNAQERIYLGRGTDWIGATGPRIFAYFVLQFVEEPKALELSWVGPAYQRLRKEMYEAAIAGRNAAGGEGQGGAEKQQETTEQKDKAALPPPPPSTRAMVQYLRRGGE